MTEVAKEELSKEELLHLLEDLHPKRGRGPSRGDGGGGRVKRLQERVRTAGYAQQGKPQAILKILSYAGHARNVQNTIVYIKENAKALEDEQGNKIVDHAHIRDIVNEWAVDFEPKPKAVKPKIKIVFIAKTEKESGGVVDRVKALANATLKENEWRLDKGRSLNRKNHITLTLHRKTVPDEITVALKSDFSDIKTKIESVKQKKTRESVHMMLSSPRGTDPDYVNHAVKEFVKHQFGEDHRYVMGLHPKTNNPHVHLVVKLFNERTGKKLDPKKNDLHAWRKLYAEKCREIGIDVDASYRSERGIGRKGEKSEVVQIRKRLKEQNKTELPIAHQRRKDEIIQEHTKGGYKPTAADIAKVKKNLKERQDYLDQAQLLRNSVKNLSEGNEISKVISMAKILEKQARSMPEPKSFRQEMLNKLDEGKKSGLRKQDKEMEMKGKGQGLEW